MNTRIKLWPFDETTIRNCFNAKVERGRRVSCKHKFLSEKGDGTSPLKYILQGCLLKPCSTCSKFMRDSEITGGKYVGIS